MTPEKLASDPRYKYHHTASAKGYVSRKSDGIVKPYSGKFGTGYIVQRPRYDTTQYIYIDYYIEI